MKKLFTIFIFFPLGVLAQSNSSVLNSFLKTEKIKPASLGLEIYNLTQQKSLLSFEAEKLLSPASLQKLLCTSAAIDILGKDFRFETKIQLLGTQETNRFTGVLKIISSGDPSLNESFVDEVYRFLKTKDISIFEGYIIVDESKFSNTPPQTWLLEDVANYYGTPAFGFNFLQNTYRLTFAQRNEGSKPDILATAPYMGHLIFDNQVISTGKKDQAYILGMPFSKERKIVGSIPPGAGTFSIKGAIDNPAQLFKNLLIKKFEEQQFGFVFNANVLANEILYTKTVKSFSLQKMITETNLNSNNLYAEALLKAMALKRFGFASEANAIKVLQEHFVKKDLLVYDGSGLSRKNRLSSAFLLSLLKANEFNAIFKSSLGVSGVSGTMKYLNSEKSKGKILGKSGSADGILNYAGYFTNSKGENIAFVFIINNYTGSRSGVRKGILSVLESYF